MKNSLVSSDGRLATTLAGRLRGSSTSWLFTEVQGKGPAGVLQWWMPASNFADGGFARAMRRMEKRRIEQQAESVTGLAEEEALPAEEEEPCVFAWEFTAADEAAMLAEHAADEAAMLAEHARAVAARRAQCEAFATGHHKRPGVGSLVLGLHLEVVRMDLDQVYE